jgi:hypothetical protein
MKKLNTRTLKLNTETLRSLSSDTLRLASGGRNAPPDTEDDCPDGLRREIGHSMYCDSYNIC